MSGNGNGAARADNAAEVMEFVEQAVLVESIEIHSIAVQIEGEELPLYAVEFIGKAGDGSNDEEVRSKVMLATSHTTALIDGLVQAAASLGDLEFVLTLITAAAQANPQQEGDDA